MLADSAGSTEGVVPSEVSFCPEFTECLSEEAGMEESSGGSSEVVTADTGESVHETRALRVGPPALLDSKPLSLSISPCFPSLE